MAAAAVAAIVALRVLVAVRERQPLRWVWLHPVTMGCTLLLQSYSVVMALSGR